MTLSVEEVSKDRKKERGKLLISTRFLLAEINNFLHHYKMGSNWDPINN